MSEQLQRYLPKDLVNIVEEYSTFDTTQHDKSLKKINQIKKYKNIEEFRRIILPPAWYLRGMGLLCGWR